MTYTVVDTKELKSIGSRFVNLAEKAEKGMNARDIANQRIIYNEHQLRNKEQLVFEFIKKNPGTIQENVVKNVPEYSRVTILKTISALEKEGIINVKIDEHNSKKYHLFINDQNVFASLTQDLDYFQKSFFNLIKETEIVLKSFSDSRSHRRKGWKLLDALIMPYKVLINTCFFSDLIYANRVTIDTNVLHKKFSIIFTKLSEIQVNLYEIISSISRWYGEDEIQTRLFSNDSTLQSLSPENMNDMLCIFEEYNLSKSAENVLDSMWEISVPILHIVDTMYYKPTLEVIGDWRKFVLKYGYKPRTTQSPYIKEMISSSFI
jgi:hypothetical protein